MKYTYQGLNACAVAMSGYQDSQQSLNGVLSVIHHTGINRTSGSLKNKAGQVGLTP